jgi:hypothetical protein
MAASWHAWSRRPAPKEVGERQEHKDLEAPRELVVRFAGVLRFQLAPEGGLTVGELLEGRFDLVLLGVLAFLALARIRSLESLRYQAPGEWGELQFRALQLRMPRFAVAPT